MKRAAFETRREGAKVACSSDGIHHLTRQARDRSGFKRVTVVGAKPALVKSR